MTKYPTIEIDKAKSSIEDFFAGGDWVIPETIWQGDGDKIPAHFFAHFDSAVQAVLSNCKSSGLNEQKQREKFEVDLGPAIYDLVQNVDTKAIMDSRFWAYLTLTHAFEATNWRHPSTKNGPPSLNNFGLVKSAIREGLLVRIYLRATLGYDTAENSFELAGVSGQDLWRSHIIRVKTGNAPLVVRAMLQDQLKKNHSVKVIRAAAKRLTQIRSNVLYETLDSEQATKLVENVYSGVLRKLSEGNEK